jgi:Zn-dependent protease with chaperone function
MAKVWSATKHAKRPFRAVFVFLALGLASVGFGGAASATPSADATTDATRDPIEEQIIVNRVHQADAEAGRHFEAATKNLDSGNLLAAITEFESALTWAPEQPDILRRQSSALGQLGRVDEALSVARRAVAIDPSRWNRIAEVTAEVLVMNAEKETGNHDPTGIVLQHLNKLTAELEAEPDSKATSQEVVVVNGLHMVYAAIVDDRPQIEYWASAVLSHDPTDSLATHLRNDAISRQLLSTEPSASPGLVNQIPWMTLLRYVALGTIMTLALIAVFLIAGEFVSRRSLKWLARTDPNQSVVNTEPFKKPYRVLIVLSGALYSIVLPVFAILAVIPPLAFSAAFLLLGRIPVGLIVGEIEAFFAVLTHTATRGWRRVVRRPSTDLPGTPLDRSEAVKLFALLEDLGRVVGTAPPDRVQLFPGTTLSVYETNTNRERVLNIGLGALVGMDQTAFAAILCHELGHYRGGDTSAGMSARRAAENMIQLSHKLRKGFFSVVLVWFLKQMWWVHSRVTMGAQRIQETLADRVAAQQFGAAAFERGLTHVYRRDVEFRHCAVAAVEGARSTGSTRSIYDPSLIPDSHRQMLNRDIAAALSKKTTLFDSHPSAQDRFREVARVKAVGRELPGMALDLFADPVALLGHQDRFVLQENGVPEVSETQFLAVYRQVLDSEGLARNAQQIPSVSR